MTMTTGWGRVDEPGRPTHDLETGLPSGWSPNDLYEEWDNEPSFDTPTLRLTAAGHPMVVFTQAGRRPVLIRASVGLSPAVIMRNDPWQSRRLVGPSIEWLGVFVGVRPFGGNNQIDRIADRIDWSTPVDAYVIVRSDDGKACVVWHVPGSQRIHDQPHDDPLYDVSRLMRLSSVRRPEAPRRTGRDYEYAYQLVTASELFALWRAMQHDLDVQVLK